MTAFIIIFALLSAFIAIYIFLIAPENSHGDGLNKDSLVPYAHRGLHGDGIPENSLPAFDRAMREGYGIELDVRLSKDGRVMVFHDDTLTRMCNINTRFDSLTKLQIDSLKLGESDCKIPSFEEVLSLVDGSVPLLIELKGEDGDSSLCDALFSLLDAYNGPFVIESFNPLLLGTVRKKRPSYTRGQLVDILSKESYKGPAPVRFMLSHLLLNFLSRPHFIAYNHKHYPRLPIFIGERFFGVRRFAWTVKDRESFEKLKKIKCVSIFEGFSPYTR